ARFAPTSASVFARSRATRTLTTTGRSSRGISAESALGRGARGDAEVDRFARLVVGARPAAHGLRARRVERGEPVAIGRGAQAPPEAADEMDVGLVGNLPHDGVVVRADVVERSGAVVVVVERFLEQRQRVASVDGLAAALAPQREVEGAAAQLRIAHLG